MSEDERFNAAAILAESAHSPAEWYGRGTRFRADAIYREMRELDQLFALIVAAEIASHNLATPAEADRRATVKRQAREAERRVAQKIALLAKRDRGTGTRAGILADALLRSLRSSLEVTLLSPAPCQKGARG